MIKILIYLLMIMFLLLVYFNIQTFSALPEATYRCSIKVNCPGSQCFCSCRFGPCDCTGMIGVGCVCDCPWWEGDSNCHCAFVPQT